MSDLTFGSASYTGQYTMYSPPASEIPTPGELAEQLNDAGIDPRQPGDLCYGRYWDEAYLVLAVVRDKTGYMTSITVLNLSQPNQSWETGTANVKTHSTNWDWRDDQFIDHNLFETHELIPYESYTDFILTLRDRAINWINPKTGRKHR
jgi:hypothetical protein